MLELKKQERSTPTRLLVYGDGGIGKTTLAASAPNAVLNPVEDIGPVDVFVLPKPETWEAVLANVDMLLNEEHIYKTYVHDSLTRTDNLITQHVCTAAGVQNLLDVPFGKLYKNVMDEWQKLLVKLESLQRNKGMGVILIAHMKRVQESNPEGMDYTRIDLDLNEKVAAKIKQWCDDVLFATLETRVVELDGKPKATTTGLRILRTNTTPFFYAKNRYNLPPSIPLRWDDYLAAKRQGRPLDPATARTQIEALAPRLPEERQAKLTEVMNKISTPQEWTELYYRVKESVS